MNLRHAEQKYVSPAIAVLSIYEAIAITSRRLPTISSLLTSLRRTGYGQVVLWVLWGWMTAHIWKAAIELELGTDGST